MNITAGVNFKPISKAVIPVAGLGTRMLPATKAIPKELLPLFDRPIIEHVVREAIHAGITEIVLITRSGKEAIENHFDAHYELEHRLTQKGKTKILDEIKSAHFSDIKISSVRQGDALGLGHAILCAEHLLAGEPFAVLLPDMFLLDAPHREPNFSLKGLVREWNESGSAQILLGEVDDEEVSAYGIADCGSGTINFFQSTSVTNLIEKPSLPEAPSKLAALGRYILPNTIFEALRDAEPGVDGEIQLTDALLDLVAQRQLKGLVTDASMYDCGNPKGFLQANLALGLRSQATRGALISLFEKLMEKGEVGN